ncbi:MAG: DUF4118 domain-containing protein [Actinobacteria bacterium]|nr:DUF4118 domain-containing protein [Actinomycetota bacterium]
MALDDNPQRRNPLNFRAPRQGLGYLIAAGGTAAFSAAMLPFRETVTPLSKGLGFLLIVVAAAAVGGVWPGMLASLLGFIAFNYLFVPPYASAYAPRLEDFVILLVFVGLSLLISTLLARARQAADLAKVRRQEFELLHSISAALVELRLGQQTYRDVVEKIVEELGFEQGALFVYEGAGLVEKVVIGGEPGTLTPSWEPSTTGRSERLPLFLEGKPMGVLVLWVENGPPLSRVQSRILRAFCDQLALSLEAERLREMGTDAESIRRTDSRRMALLVAVSDELRSPLDAIKTTVTDLISEDATDGSDKVDESLRRIYVETEKLSSLVANMLDMSRIESGLVKPRVQDVSVEKAIAKVLERIRSNYPHLRVYVSAYESDVVWADPELLDRVVTNLLDHAVSASESTGADRIEVIVSEEGEQAKVAVVDHSEGIPHGDREQLFYPLYKLDERHQHLGSGLGLATVKGFVALMDGDVWVEDTAGGGATIAFSLPVSEQAAAAGRRQ